MRVHHIGYLVKNIDDAIKEFEKLGFTGKETVRDEYRGIDICFMDNNGYCVELVSPYCDESTVAGLIKKYKNAPYHLCYISNDFDRDIKELSDKGYVQMGEAKAAPAIDGHRVVFMMNGSIGMIEIVEEE